MYYPHFSSSNKLLSLFLTAFLALCWPVILFSQPNTAEVSGKALVLEIDGPIGPAVSDYIQKGIKSATDYHAQAVVILMNTPGGLDSAMRDIIQAILLSPVPVFSYVFPEGSRAASAGTYILYASHVAAMAPATNIGAATPVQIGGLPSSPDSPKKPTDGENEGKPAPANTMQRKMINDAAAYIRSLAHRNGRNGDWAEKAVKEAVSLSATEAMALHVIDYIATDIHELLLLANGKNVTLSSGSHTLQTSELSLDYLLPDWKNQILSIISDPNIAYLLLLVGMYGLIYELANPGVFFPGVAGAISILLALYGFQVLPVNYSGIALIILGIGLLVSEAFIPSFGSLGIGGIIAFATGSFILFDDQTLRISISLIVITTLLSAAFLLWLTSRLLLYRKRSVRTGSEAIVGMTGEVIEEFRDEGRIWLLGESWQARNLSSEILPKGQIVKVIAVDGLLLTVQKTENEGKR